MTFQKCAVLLMSLVAQAVFSVEIVLARPLSDHDIEVLKGRELIVEVSRDEGEGAAAASVFAAIDIAAPRSVIWALMVDCEKAHLFVADLHSCEVVEAGGDGAWDVRKHVIRYSRFLPQTENVFRSDYAPYSEIRFQKAGGDLKIMEGVWRLSEIDHGAGSRLTYESRLALGKPVPRPLIRRAVRGDVPKILLSLRDASEAAAGDSN